MVAESGRPNEGIDTASRRLLKALFSGAIPVNLFSQFSKLLVASNAGETLKFFGSQDFEKSVLNLSFLDTEEIDYRQILQQPLENLKDHLFNSSNEATLRSLFWDQILNRLFLFGQEGNEKNYRLSSEWMTRKLFPKLEDRKIDFVASIKPGQKRHPIFIVEAGVEGFDSKNPHKDFSKLINVMSLSCISMARDLASEGKTPENARVYGIWIGGMKFQFCVAHPVITKRNDEKFDIHTVITYEDEWIFDLFSETPRNGPVVPGSTPETAEAIQPGLVLDYVFSNLEFDKNISNYVLEKLSEEAVDPIEIETTRARTSVPTDENEHLLYKGTLNYLVLKRLHVFIDIVKKRIDLIVNEMPKGDNNDQNKREFSEESQFGLIDSARESSVKETPLPNQISQARANKRKLFDEAGKHISSPKFDITKDSFKELEILRKLALFPDFFATLYSATVVDKRIDYEFERMFPLVNLRNSSFSREIHFPHPLDSMFACIKFSVQCLAGLHLLHDYMNLVHSDISVNNIMFSLKSKSWKIIDFDQSMEIEDSLKYSRKAGTRGFIAPESEATGIFTPKSDIFSLGTVFIDYLNSILIDQILLDESGLADSDLRSWFNSFNSIALSMIRPDPEKRPTALEALKGMFTLLNHYYYDEEDSKYVTIKNILGLQSDKDRVIESSIKKDLESGQVMMPRRLKTETEQKEPMISLPLEIQKNLK